MSEQIIQGDEDPAQTAARRAAWLARTPDRPKSIALDAAIDAATTLAALKTALKGSVGSR